MLPEKITLVEVGPRDGFQNVKESIATEDKIAIINGMIKSGVRQMEITSFVNPKWLPQMADAADVAAEILKTAPADFRAIALVPNKRGVENAVKTGLKNVTYVVSASESHNQKNVNRPIEKSLEELKDIQESFGETIIRVSLATSFGCPFEGEVPLDNVLRVLHRLSEIGIGEVVLCDTIGVGNPLQVQKTVQAVKAQFPDLTLGLHFHDTRGMGLSNIYAGLNEGIAIYETSVGGLGGCPFAPGSAGNTATEDMLNMVSSMGIAHDIDMDQYLAVVNLVKERVKAPLTGRVSSMCRQ